MNSEIELPSSWHSLSAGGTRFAIMLELYRIAHWNDQTYANSKGQFIKGFCDVFVDDTMFCSSSSSMIGLSLFQDELEFVTPFCRAFRKFLDTIDAGKWIIEKEFTEVRRDEIELPEGLIKCAENLYHVMLKRGDPDVGRYQ